MDYKGEIEKYLWNIYAQYQAGRASEHTYRPYIQTLLNIILPDILVTNEPSRIKCGVPDILIRKNNIPIGYVETKDIGVLYINDKEQFNKYINALPNIIFTDYLNFSLYIDKEKVKEVTIAEISDCKLSPLYNNFSEFIEMIQMFGKFEHSQIETSKDLVKEMANKTRLLRDLVEKTLCINESDNYYINSIKVFYHNLKAIVIKNSSEKEFSDLFAQLITYGMFAARLRDTSKKEFTVSRAEELTPESIPLLKALFRESTQYETNSEFRNIIENIALLFQHADVQDILKTFEIESGKSDKLIYFYEEFLKEYDKERRKLGGIWATPDYAAKFMISMVDWVLKEDFNMPDGLLSIEQKSRTVNKKKIQIPISSTLDPVLGTGVFHIQNIIFTKEHFKGNISEWNSYVNDILINRLYGFEISIVSYIVAHMRIRMALEDTGYKFNDNIKLNIYLTNSLENDIKDTTKKIDIQNETRDRVFEIEVRETKRIKDSYPIMIIYGNPPYNSKSSNNSDWIRSLMLPCGEINGNKIKGCTQWLNDDYVKFILAGTDYIVRNKRGVLEYITNNGYLTNYTFNGFRHHLLEIYDKIYIINLHGDVKFPRFSEDTNEKDENIFDIKQGVAIGIFIKNKIKKEHELAEVYYTELIGSRRYKRLKLSGENSIDNIIPYFEKIEYSGPDYLFVPVKRFDVKEETFKIDELYKYIYTGMGTCRDNLTIAFNYKLMIDKYNIFVDKTKSNSEIRKIFFSNKGGEDNREWKMDDIRTILSKQTPDEYIKSIIYRPFDERQIYYYYPFISNIPEYMEALDGYKDIDENLENVALTFGLKGIRSVNGVAFATDRITNNFGSGKIRTKMAHLLNYDKKHANGEITDNLNPDIIKKFSSILKLKYEIIKKDKRNFDAFDIFDYVYARLYDLDYIKKNKEIFELKGYSILFPNINTFWKYVNKGRELRILHLLKNNDPIPDDYKFCGEFEESEEDKNNKILDFRYSEHRVYINERQSFPNISEEVYNFNILGTTPVKQYLYDRKWSLVNSLNNIKLTVNDIYTYMKITQAIKKTIKIMEEISEI